MSGVGRKLEYGGRYGSSFGVFDDEVEMQKYAPCKGMEREVWTFEETGWTVRGFMCWMRVLGMYVCVVT